LGSFVAAPTPFCNSARDNGKPGEGVHEMGLGSWWHWVILLGVILLVFGGRGKISDLMGDVAKGIKSFKKGLADDPAEADADKVKSLEQAAETKVGDKVKS
jgi:sec-independent protein translocase protein TatA